MLVNATGSTLLGFVIGLAMRHALPSTPKLLIGTGFCGAYTTFSTFAFETVQLRGERAVLESVANAAGTLVTGLAGAATGLALAAVL